MYMSKYIKYIVKTIYLKLIFLAFWDAKLFIKFLNSKFSWKEAIVREFDYKSSSKKQKSLIALISICKLQQEDLIEYRIYKTIDFINNI